MNGGVREVARQLVRKDSDAGWGAALGAASAFIDDHC